MMLFMVSVARNHFYKKQMKNCRLAAYLPVKCWKLFCSVFNKSIILAVQPKSKSKYWLKLLEVRQKCQTAAPHYCAGLFAFWRWNSGVGSSFKLSMHPVEYKSTCITWYFVVHTWPLSNSTAWFAAMLRQCTNAPTSNPKFCFFVFGLLLFMTP